MRTVPRIPGRRVELRPLRADDEAARLHFGQDDEYARMNGIEPLQARSFDARSAARWFSGYERSLRWAIDVDGRFIGEVRLDDLERVSGEATFAIGIFDAGERDRGLGTESTLLALDYAFRGLGLECVRLRVLAINQRAIRCYEKCGFVVDGTREDAAFVEGRWQGDLTMSARRPLVDGSRE
jgi:RimJ/RimL family protein N-acetyltransferase